MCCVGKYGKRVGQHPSNQLAYHHYEAKECREQQFAASLGRVASSSLSSWSAALGTATTTADTLLQEERRRFLRVRTSARMAVAVVVTAHFRT